MLALTTFDDDEVLAGMLPGRRFRLRPQGRPGRGSAARGPRRRRRRRLARSGRHRPGAGHLPVRCPAGHARTAELAALTAREREVLTLIGEGKTNAEIATALFVSEGTVKTHINHVFTKLGLRDRAAAMVFAFDHHMVTRPR